MKVTYIQCSEYLLGIAIICPEASAVAVSNSYCTIHTMLTLLLPGVERPTAAGRQPAG